MLTEENLLFTSIFFNEIKTILYWMVYDGNHNSISYYSRLDCHSTAIEMFTFTILYFNEIAW